MSEDFYRQFILPHQGIIIKICRAYTNNEVDFEDYYQEVCLQIWRNRDKFSGQSKWSTWLYRVSLNVCLTLLKKDKKHGNQYSSDAIPDSEEVQTEAFSDESLNQLYNAIKKLSEVDRAVILMYLEEKSYQEIAEVIGTNSNNIGVRITRIKNRLKKLLDGHYN